MAVAEVAQTRRGGGAVALVGLLAAAIFINYIDRGNLATAAPLIKDEFRLNNFQIGVMTSAFFWIYTPSQLLAGWLADRLNPYRALALGFAVWSAATALTGFAGGVCTFLALRLLLGLGARAAFPCLSQFLARHVPGPSPYSRGFLALSCLGVLGGAGARARFSPAWRICGRGLRRPRRLVSPGVLLSPASPPPPPLERCLADC